MRCALQCTPCALHVPHVHHTCNQVASGVRRVWLLGGHVADVRAFNATLAHALAAIPRQHLGMAAWQGVYAKEVLGGEKADLEAPSSGWIGTGVERGGYAWVVALLLPKVRPIIMHRTAIMTTLACLPQGASLHLYGFNWHASTAPHAPQEAAFVQALADAENVVIHAAPCKVCSR